MIPKIIHYVWLPNEKKPLLVKKCIASWKKNMPDWKIKLWNMENSPVKIPFVKEAILRRKWASAADYIRLYALYTGGGVYLDADVFVKKSFDDFLEHDFFTGVEFNRAKFESMNQADCLNPDGTKKSEDLIIQGLSVQSAIVGSKSENPIIKEMMEWYEKSHFVLEDGTLNYKYLAPDLMANVLEHYGFRYKNERQTLKIPNAVIYPTEYFASGVNFQNPKNYAVHCYTSSWQDASFLGILLRRAKYFAKILKL